VSFAFYSAALVAVLATLGVIAGRNPVHALLNLIVSLLAVAMIFFAIGAPFAAVLEIIVYAGAIMVLFTFTIMLLNAGAEKKTNRKVLRTAVALPLLFTLAGIGAYLAATQTPKTSVVQFGAFTAGPLEIGRALFTTYLLPFEVTSVLILIAILGAIVLARKEIPPQCLNFPSLFPPRSR
jgi:NADH-quinone oxidoreductase subunit J